MRGKWLVGVLAGVLVLAGTAGGAVPKRATTYVYDVRVTGTIGNRETQSGTENGDGPVDLTLTYQIAFDRVAVRVNPVTRTVRTVVSAKKSGLASGKFSFTSRASKNQCSGTFDFSKMAATLTLTASGERVRAPRFELRAEVGTRGEDALITGIQKAEAKCPTTRPDPPQPPNSPFPSGRGIMAYVGPSPKVMFRRDTWDVKSQPLVRLLPGESFTLDTGVRRQSTADLCEPGSCVRQLSARVRVEFRRAR